ncbi:uncharacterized protein SAPINGB_P004633 [Magnusiomyces paraingens]|uniref:Polysaccharide biosynthesis domain-containing protein n=1 Tax=Magnusiomyces paraingens TaxID=2606893 RepID=A0A5E8BWL6_9ASCO|nr:uncharacterized protein SAPINGB_P004633 [Saprochaete ingens]VVT55511.1 unnamed protein product [Saprochaete ingens]
MSKPFSAEDAENLEAIEQQFAVKAVAQAEAYWSLLRVRKGSDLRLTPLENEIYDHFVSSFPEYLEEPERVRNLNETKDLKSPEAKKRWREYLNVYEKKMDEFNFGTLLRLSANDEYTEQNTTFSVRAQFYAIEVFRNRHCMNDWIYEQAQKEKEAKK